MRRRGTFLSKLHTVAETTTQSYQLLKPLKYYSCLAERLIEVPRNFCTDFASVPRIPGVYWLFGNRATYPATVHDYLYRRAIVSRYIADRVFLEAMLSRGMNYLMAYIMYLAVRLFGQNAYNHDLTIRRNYYA